METLTIFEYNNLQKEVNYYSDICYLKDKSFHCDFIFSIVLDKYIKYKQKVDYITNEKIICAVQRSICKKSVLDYMYKKNINYNTCKINEEFLSLKSFVFYGDDEIEYQLNLDDIGKKLSTIFSSLTEDEQALFELLSDKKISKNEACNFLNITKECYDNFIYKLKKIINKVI